MTFLVCVCVYIIWLTFISQPEFTLPNSRRAKGELYLPTPNCWLCVDCSHSRATVFFAIYASNPLCWEVEVTLLFGHVTEMQRQRGRAQFSVNRKRVITVFTCYKNSSEPVLFKLWGGTIADRTCCSTTPSQTAVGEHSPLLNEGHPASFFFPFWRCSGALWSGPCQRCSGHLSVSPSLLKLHS